MNLKPLGARLIVKTQEEKVTASGIVIPDTAEKDRPQQGTVVAVGVDYSGEKERVLPVVVGDKVLFGKYSGSEVEYSGESYLILKEEDVLAVIAE